MACSPPLAVAAIDFGTTFSGWAFSFRHEPTKVSAKNWNSGDHISPKTPTAILIKPDGKTLEAFGYEAENKYIDLSEEDNHKDYYFFYRFKMMLFKQKTLSRGTKLESVDGKSLEAMTVFKLAIGYLKDDLIKENESILRESDVHWTLTVPAIWNEKAKKFMREAAIKAGISSHNLTIVLEPESASIFCQHIAIDKSYGGHIASLAIGSTYVLIDCGGGTIDICCHRILEDHKLEEIYKANGDAVGGSDVDKAFEEFLVNIFGQETWSEFKRHNEADFLYIFRNFEVKKRVIKPQGGDPVTICLPAQLISILQSTGNQSLQDAVTQAAFGDVIKVLKGNKIKVNCDCLRENVYDAVVTRFRSLISEVFSNEQVKNTHTVLLAGGFSESLVIVDALKSLYPNKQIITIHEPSLAVVKGAVIYGHDESLVQKRITRYTYGKGLSAKFDATIHDENQSWVGDDGVIRVNLFKPLVRAGEELSVDDTYSSTSHPNYEDQTSITYYIYAVDGNDDIPTYVDDPRCIELGEITIPITDMSVPRKDRKCKLNLKIGGTEIKATCFEKLTGNSVEANIDFLG